MGQICSEFVREQPSEEYTLSTEEDVTDELLSQSQIPVQCKDNPEGRGGMVVFDMEAFPMVNILCRSS
ncbi:hypothetical protein F2P79_001796 [Pimephales promelas]|nr:hypothetical protein F2P79_001796 [Pimephales promelas]